LHELCLPSGLILRLYEGVAPFAKDRGAANIRIGRGLLDRVAHVTDPGRAGTAPSASRTLMMCSA